MSPESFNFTVTLPGDHRLVGVVRDICAHAVGYAKLPEDAGASFCARVAEAAVQAVANRPDAPCALVFDCTERRAPGHRGRPDPHPATGRLISAIHSSAHSIRPRSNRFSPSRRITERMDSPRQ